MKTKEVKIPLDYYPMRTCGWKNKKKIRKMLTRALSSGVLVSFTGVSVINRREV